MKYSVLPPESVEEVFNQVSKHLPDALRSLEAFALLYSSMGTMFFEVGLLGGVFWLTNVHIGWKATVHVVFWDEGVREELLKSVVHTRSIIDDVFQLLRLQRLEAYIPVRKRTACQYAERLGFAREGVLRKFDKYDEDFVDIVVYGLLKEDL